MNSSLRVPASRWLILFPTITSLSQKDARTTIGNSGLFALSRSMNPEAIVTTSYSWRAPARKCRTEDSPALSFQIFKSVAILQGKVRRGNNARRATPDNSFQEIPKFSNIAWPVVARQAFQYFVGEPIHLTSEFLIEYAQVVFEQSRNVLPADRKSTRLNSSHLGISYAV